MITRPLLAEKNILTINIEFPGRLKSCRNQQAQMLKNRVKTRLASKFLISLKLLQRFDNSKW